MGNQAENISALSAALDTAGDRTRVADLLPYRFMGTVGRISMVHLLEDQSLGIGFEIGVPACESTIGGQQYMADLFDRILRIVPAGYVLQFYRRNSSNVIEYLELYRSYTSEDQIANFIAEATVQRWENAMEDGFFPKHDLNFYPTSERMALMVKCPPTGSFGFSAEQAWELLLNPEAGSKKFGEEAERFELLVRQIQEAAAAARQVFTPMGPDQFVPFVISQLYPNDDHRAPMPKASEVESMADAISSAGEIDLTNGSGKVKLDGFRSIRNGKESFHKVVSMIWQPKAVGAGMADALMYAAPNITFITTIEMLNQGFESVKLKAEQFVMGRTVTAFNKHEAAAKNKSFNDVITRMFEGERICRVRVQAHVSASTEEKARDAALRVSSAMDPFNPQVEDVLATSLALPASLPLTFSREREKKFQRSRKMLSKDIAEMMPASGRWTGVIPSPKHLAPLSYRNKSVALYANAVGGPLFVNPDACDENPHVCVAGSSGGGKSFWVNDHVAQTWRAPNIRTYIVSIKPDYRRMAHYLGRYLEIDLDSDISLNPLGGKPTKTNQERWTAAICLMLSGGEHDRRPDTDQEVLISECVMRAAIDNWDDVRDVEKKETILSDVVAHLEKAGDLGNLIARRLHPYHKGQFSNLINRPRTLQDTDRFVFFNLAKVREAKCLPVLMFCLFGYIDSIMYDPRHTGVSKVVVFDEGWAGMGDPASAKLFQTAARAYRSLGGKAIFISQSFDDYNNDLGRAILANTATKIVLPQEQTELEKLPKFIKLNSLELAAASSIKLQKGAYSEFFVKMQGKGSTTGRLIANPLVYALATSEDADEALYQRLVEECDGNHRNAIHRFAKEFPFGNRAVH